YDRRLDTANSLIDTFGAVANIDTSSHSVSFQANFRISSESFPVVVGADPVINSSYMGDYDQADADNGNFYFTWGDNRNLNTTGIRHQADVRFVKIQTGMQVIGTSPAEGDILGTAPTDFVIHFSDPYDPGTVDASDLTVNGVAANKVDQTDSTTLTFHYD